MNNEIISIPRCVISDPELSLKAKGLYAVILSLPMHWNCSVQELVEVQSDGRSAVSSALRELELKGYVRRHQMKDDSGRFAGYEYEVRQSKL